MILIVTLVSLNIAFVIGAVVMTGDERRGRRAARDPRPHGSVRLSRLSPLEVDRISGVLLLEAV